MSTEGDRDKIEDSHQGAGQSSLSSTTALEVSRSASSVEAASLTIGYGSPHMHRERTTFPHCLPVSPGSSGSSTQVRQLQREDTGFIRLDNSLTASPMFLSLVGKQLDGHPWHSHDPQEGQALRRACLSASRGSMVFETGLDIELSTRSG
ncbi:hypothetical protein LZ30DRAFT_695143 [Colletotrichum cereale]|nr:hypothetical protein LZ30DRAFT_695143 [Colletotrichum cereale]